MRFLADTLRKRQTLHEAKASSYFSVRAWRSTMKKHEQEALASIRQYPSVAVADFIATEIFELAVRSYGKNTIDYVVPIPSGEGEVPDNLPEMLAQRVAEKLECKSLLALQLVGGGVSASGKPKAKTMKLVMPLQGSILLVTDFAETHERMDNAQKAIRKLEIPSFAISWIAP